MAKPAAGILMYRFRHGQLEVLLVHPGGPLWANRDLESWSIPKGESSLGEEFLDAAKREFEEETGFPVTGRFLALRPITYAGGKVIHAWAVEGDLDAAAIKSNLFTLEWPPKSGQMKRFPEIDRGEWFSIPEARAKILQGQRELLEELTAIVVAKTG